MKQSKKTLYDLLIDSYKLAGKNIEEGSWSEDVEYRNPTNEYWFDVTINEDDSGTRHQLHFFFGSDKNTLLYTEYWTSKRVVDYVNFLKVF